MTLAVAVCPGACSCFDTFLLADDGCLVVFIAAMCPVTTKLATGKLVPLGRIRRLAEEIVRKFHPNKIILFGSYARGEATDDSDVDLLVILKTGAKGVDSLRIRRSTRHDFPMDLIAMSQKKFDERLGEGDFFLSEILERGVVLYEEKHP